jgi:hypothetical protein
MAKEPCMIQRTDKGKQARQYFLDVEKQWNSPESIMARAQQIAQRTIAGLSSRVNLLESENKLLAQQSVKWSNRKVLEAIVKAYGSYISRNFKMLNGYQEAWREFKKEALYMHSINLNLRITNHMNASGKKTAPKTLDMIHDDELPACISTAVAMCRNHSVDISEIIEKYQDKVSV